MIKSPNVRLALGILIVNVLMHFVALDRPWSVVFDEVHFGKFISGYCCTSENIFDIHPPHAKLFIAGAAKAGGYDGKFAFKDIGNDYGSVPIGWMRAWPALWGSLLPVALFALLLALGASQAAAFLGALMITFDNAFLIQSRIIALDSLLVLATIFTLYCAVIARDLNNWRKKIAWSLLGGVAAGFAVGVKITGLVAPALFMILIATRDYGGFRQKMLQTLRSTIWMATGFLAVYLTGWKVHFMLLSKKGWGDAYYRYTGNFFEDLARLHRVMIERNASITIPHSDASVWWEWPMMTRPIYYWSNPDHDMYFIGNPTVWWSLSFFFLGFICFQILRRTSLLTAPRSSRMKVGLWFPFVAFLMSYVPFIEVTRPLFLYHFMTPLIFALITVLLWLDQIGFTNEGGIKEQRKSYYAYIGFILAGFILIMPLTYGLPKTLWGDTIFRLFPGWR